MKSYVITIFIFASFGIASKLPPNSTKVTVPSCDGTGIEYFYYPDEKLTRKEAAAKCKEVGSKLADINNSSMSLLSAVVKNKAWVGSVHGSRREAPLLFFPPEVGRDGEYHSIHGAVSISVTGEKHAFVCQAEARCRDEKVVPSGCLDIDFDNL